MDILVTTPQSEIDNSRKEGKIVETEGGYWFRAFRYKPKVEPNDKIYFVENGLIRGYGIIFEVSQLDESADCDITGREWGEAGGYIVKYNNWHWIKSPVPFKGFQGIRYINNKPELKKQLSISESIKQNE